MYKINFSYNAMPISIKEAAVQSETAGQLLDSINMVLAPLKYELDSLDVEILIDIKTSRISFRNLSPELRDKVHEALLGLGN